MCRWSDRQFEWNYALALHTGRLRSAIRDFKYHDQRRWALIFGRILAGALELDPDNFREFNLILPSPTFVGEGGRDFDHTRLVIEVAANEVPKHSTWPFDLFDEATIRKTAATRSLATRTWQQRRQIALEIRDALHVAHPERVRGKRVLVYDDVFTDGTTLNEVARALRQQAGAAEVCGVSLCRQPFNPRPVAQPDVEIPF